MYKGKFQHYHVQTFSLYLLWIKHFQFTVCHNLQTLWWLKNWECGYHYHKCGTNSHHCRWLWNLWRNCSKHWEWSITKSYRWNPIIILHCSIHQQCIIINLWNHFLLLITEKIKIWGDSLSSPSLMFQMPCCAAPNLLLSFCRLWYCILYQSCTNTAGNSFPSQDTAYPSDFSQCLFATFIVLSILLSFLEPRRS